jgi:hypothetical protein
MPSAPAAEEWLTAKLQQATLADDGSTPPATAAAAAAAGSKKKVCQIDAGAPTQSPGRRRRPGRQHTQPTHDAIRPMHAHRRPRRC